VARLSPHFEAHEFDSHDGVQAPPRFLYWAQKLCRGQLEPLRREFGAVTVISGFRTFGHNDDVGGAPSSYHLRIPGRRGAAVDLRCARGAPRDWYELLDARGCPGLGLYDDHVHADNRRGRARW